MNNQNEQLNKYIAESGICSRRKATDLIKTGQISINENIVTDPTYRLQKNDIVKYNGSKIKPQRKVYILLNKPKDYITTRSDERGRKTVLELIDSKIKERIFPIGRLDRATTGLLILTNDGELSQKLAHPSNEVEKVYQVTLKEELRREDFIKLSKGLTLEDGFIKPDFISFNGKQKKIVNIGLHSGKNRIVRRLFEYLGYHLSKLDRIQYAGLTKENLAQGKWRFLTTEEITYLKS